MHALYSIFSVDRLVFPGEKVIERVPTLSIYTRDKEAEWEPSCSSTSELSFMPLYSFIKSRQLIHCEGRVTDAMLGVMVSFDKLMGLSYLSSANDYEPLFDLSEDGVFMYARTEPYDAGDCYVHYRITYGDPDVFLYKCLLRYTAGDKLWSSRAYIYSIDDEGVVMYIPDLTREKCMTQISQLYYDYGIDHRNDELVLEIS